jgi:hypothetical protein
MGGKRRDSMKASEFYERIEFKRLDYWGEYPGYSSAEWQQEVAAGDTRLGYWDWALFMEEFDGANI